MTPVFARRRADEFDTLVEERSTDRVDDLRYAEFLAVVAALRDVPATEPRPEFVADLRERLMSAAETVLVPAAESRLTLPERRPARERRIAAIVGGIAIVGAGTSMAVAAQSALPGDTLYPLKRILENAETSLTVSEGQKGAALLTNASGRLDEVAQLSRAGRLEDGDAIADTLTAFTEQSTEASDLLFADYADTGDRQSIRDLRDFTSSSMETLADLETMVPAEARDELLHAAQVLAQIDAEAQRACPTCGGADITEVPAILTSAGYASDQGVVSTLDGATEAADGNQGGKGRDGQQQPAETGQSPVSPGDVPTLPGQTGGSGSSTPGGGGGSLDDPITSLTNGLIGEDDGSQSTTNGGGGGGGGQAELPDLDDVIDDVTDPLLNP